MSNQHSTAFPAQAAQDNFGKIFTPFPGFTKYEYVLLQFALKADFNIWPGLDDEHEIAAAIMRGAEVMADAYFAALESEEENKNSFTIIK